MSTAFIWIRIYGFISDPGVLASGGCFGISLTALDLGIKILFGAPLFLIGCIKLYKEIKGMGKIHPELKNKLRDKEAKAERLNGKHK